MDSKSIGLCPQGFESLRSDAFSHAPAEFVSCLEMDINDGIPTCLDSSEKRQKLILLS